MNTTHNPASDSAVRSDISGSIEAAYTLRPPHWNYLPSAHSSMPDGRGLNYDRWYVIDNTRICPLTKKPSLAMVGTKEDCECFIARKLGIQNG